jgi:hypothetical protein
MEVLQRGRAVRRSQSRVDFTDPMNDWAGVGGVDSGAGHWDRAGAFKPGGRGVLVGAFKLGGQGVLVWTRGVDARS